MEIDNSKFHIDPYDGSLILDDDGEPIPKTICICHAYNKFSCVCGAWDLDDDDEFDFD